MNVNGISKKMMSLKSKKQYNVYLLLVLKLKKFIYAVTRVIYRIRFDNRMSKIRAFLKGATKRSEVEKLVNQDW